jgi:3-hydroxyisobutyrate dehydrogenase-like beta-hydroxyacid dehydrogenase
LHGIAQFCGLSIQPRGSSMKAVSVIGLGKMGSALAGALLRAGHRVTVWNRSPEKAAGLAVASVARSAADAVAASPLTIVCVSDYEATRAILAQPEVASSLAGRTLVQLSTGTPKEARDLQLWVRGQRAAYLDGAILAWPRHIGGDQTLVYVSGEQAAYDAHGATLRALAGGLTYLGGEVGASEGMFAAILSYLAGRWIGICHGGLICEAEGLSAAAYGDALAMLGPALAWDAQHMGQVISTHAFTNPESTLETTARDIEGLVRQAQDARINPEWPRFAAELFSRAERAGYGPEEHAALIKTLRQPA